MLKSLAKLSNILDRSSCPEVLCKKGVIRNFATFTGKHLCQSLFFNKVAGAVCNFITKEAPAQMFSCEFWEIFKNNFLHGTLLVAASDLTIIWAWESKYPLEMFCWKGVLKNLQILQENTCIGWRFRKIHRKTPAPESLFW